LGKKETKKGIFIFLKKQDKEDYFNQEVSV